MAETEKVLLNIKRHSRYALMAFMLETCKEPKAKFDIYCTRPKELSYKLLDELLTQALKLKLLKQKDDKYSTTLKGKELIKKFEELLKFLKEG
jgi:predicted transcriptional regulator